MTRPAEPDGERLRQVAHDYGVHIYAERSRRLFIVIGPDGDCRVEVKDNSGVSVRRSVADGLVEIATPVSRTDQLIRAARWAGRQAQRLVRGRYLLVNEGPVADPPTHQPHDIWWPAERLADLLDQLVRARRSGDGYELGFIAEVVARSVAISTVADSIGKDEDWSRLSCFAKARDGTDLTKTSHIGGWLDGDRADAMVLEHLVARTSRQADGLRDAPPTAATTGPVILEPAAAGTLMHEVVGHLLERDNVLARRCDPPVDRGSRIGPDLLTVLHDPTLAPQWSGAAVDDEGTPTGPIALVRAGVVAGHLSDTAHADGRGSSGDGRRSSFDVPVVPRMRTVRVEPGADDDTALLDDIGSGVLVKTLRRAIMTPRTGRCVAEIGAAEMIEGGRSRGASRGGVIACSVTDLLGRIDGVGRDTAVTHDLCDKAGQRLPTSAWSPRIRLGAVAVR
jgi:TldD protein